MFFQPAPLGASNLEAFRVVFSMLLQQFNLRTPEAARALLPWRASGSTIGISTSHNHSETATYRLSDCPASSAARAAGLRAPLVTQDLLLSGLLGSSHQFKKPTAYLYGEWWDPRQVVAHSSSPFLSLFWNSVGTREAPGGACRTPRTSK